MTTTRTHYEKIICVCCLLLLFTNVGLASTSFNVYQPHLVSMVGDKNASNILLLRTLVSLICMILVGKWYKLLDCRLGASLAGCCTAVGFLVFSFSESMVGLCAGAVLTGAGYGLGGMVASTILIGRWYKTKVGTALGIAATGSSIAAIVIPLCASGLISSIGLSWTFRLEALLAFSLATLCFALIRNYPKDLGLTPFGANEGPNAGADATTATTAASNTDVATAKSASITVNTNSSATTDASATASTNSADIANATESFATTTSQKKEQQPLSTWSRRILMIAILFMGCVAVDGWNYLSVLMTQAHFDSSFVAPLISTAALVMLCGKLSIGVLCDKIGTLRASIVFFGVLLFGLILCALADFGNLYLMVLGTLLFGFGVSIGTVGISAWSIDLSTPAERSKLIKDLQVAYAFGGFIFNLAPGRIVEAGGSYSMSYIALAILCVIGAVIVVLVYRHAKKNA